MYFVLKCDKHLPGAIFDTWNKHAKNRLMGVSELTYKEGQ